MQGKLNLNDIQALIVDMDGVLWRGYDPLPGLLDFFGFLAAQQLPYILATNNAANTPDQFTQKLAKLGVKTVKTENILTSSIVAATYLKREYEAGTKVYVVGQEGLRAAMRDVGFVLLEDSSQPADIVVAGVDFSLTYDKLKHATLLIQRGARFIGTNGDLTYPSEEGFAPAAGTILAAIEAATGVKPLTVGKPESLMFEIAVEKMDTSSERTAMIGDRLDTDILGGQRAGLKTILVTTGIDNESSCQQKGIQPDAIFSGIDELVNEWVALK